MAEDDDLEKKAKSGNIQAIRSLATLYELGIDRPADPAKAFTLWLKVANAGDPHAQLTVATMYEQGEGVSQDSEKAGYWRDLASRQNVRPWDAEPAGPPSGRKKILVVDDDPSFTGLIEELARGEGYETVYAHSAESALSQISKNPDLSLLLLDLVLPKISGIQFLRTLRKMKVLQGVPVVAVSANFMEKTVRELKKLGVNDFIAKPVSKTLFREKLFHIKE